MHDFCMASILVFLFTSVELTFTFNLLFYCNPENYDTEYSKVFNNRTVPIKNSHWKTAFRMACKNGEFDVVK